MLDEKVFVLVFFLFFSGLLFTIKLFFKLVIGVIKLFGFIFKAILSKKTLNV